MSPFDYDVFAKVKEPLRGTRYNTRDELIRSVGRSVRDIIKDGRPDGVRHLANIWQKSTRNSFNYNETNARGSDACRGSTDFEQEHWTHAERLTSLKFVINGMSGLLPETTQAKTQRTQPLSQFQDGT